MASRVVLFEQACMRALRRPAPVGKINRLWFWTVLGMGLVVGLAFLPGAVGTIASVFAIALSPFAFFLFVIVAYRFSSARLLWKVRNRLILTSLLMGLAPVVLFGTLAAISAYTFAGQFATSAAIVELNDEIGRLRDRATATAAPIERLLELELTPHDLQNFHLPRGSAVSLPAAQPRHRAGLDAAITETVWVDGKPFEAPGERAAAGAEANPTGGSPNPFAGDAVPGWLKPGFSGVIQRDGKLYVAAAVGGETGGRTLIGLATTSLDHSNLQALAKGLGTISVFRTSSIEDEEVDEETPRAAGRHERSSPLDFLSIEGGHVPRASHFFDGKVVFTAPLPVTEWRTGADVHAMLGVVSRPTLLYSRLFATSVHIGSLVRNGLIVITIFFALLELLAFLLALRLSRTITQSIAELYSATTQIDRGNLGHRIEVQRKDQLGALATSFNTMAGSLAELLVQQREKERMQNELEIAQEVQNNLFPDTPIRVRNLEVHGVCKPARTVSGDYYDFIHSEANAPANGQLCLALGDISGKGISAALLMASLHSAVRAYHSSEPVGGRGEGFPAPSPGRLLALLNRHLFSSTQPEKYATLFVACYDSHRQELTYSNGGHLTPLVFRANGQHGPNGQVEKLECGGSVVGLLDGLHYAEGTVRLDPGDLLVIYSDGLTEPENEFGEFGEERLMDVLQQNHGAPLDAIAAKVMRSLETWIGENEQPDDMTLVLARQL